MNNTLENLLERRQKLQDAIDNVLEAGQEFQTRTGRVKMANLQTLQQQLANLDREISDLQGNGYTDTECYVFRGCR